MSQFINEPWVAPVQNEPWDPPRFPGWRYGPGGKKAIFQCEEEVPEGWTDNPNDHDKIEYVEPVIEGAIEEAMAEAATYDVFSTESAEEFKLEMEAEEDLSKTDAIDALAKAGVDFNPKWPVGKLNRVLRDHRERNG